MIQCLVIVLLLRDGPVQFSFISENASVKPLAAEM